MNYKIISSSSKGNAIVYFNEILVDLGVSEKEVDMNIKCLLLTHEHGDHYKPIEIRKLQLRTNCKVICCDYLSKKLDRAGIEHIVIETNKMYKLGDYLIGAFNLYHDVPNCGYRIIKNGYKVFHATDTNTLKGVLAKEYDLYAIEHNYDADTIQDVINEKESIGQFSYERGAIKRHLSFQDAASFFKKNRKEDSVLIKLHVSDRYELDRD